LPSTSLILLRVGVLQQAHSYLSFQVNFAEKLCLKYDKLFIFDMPFILGLERKSFLHCHKEEIVFVVMQKIFSFQLFFEDPGLDHII
jgi:hypothetical protein